MIVVEHLRKVFPNGHVALADVSLTIGPGEIVCVVGRSGAGKSTLLRCLNGTLDATAGRVSVDNVEVTRATGVERRRLRRRIGFVYQELNLVERVSVLRNVLVGRLGHASPLATCLGLFSRADRELALFNLDRVHLLDRAGQRADTLSGGEKQRVAIARAMTQEPLVLLADEPVASLDRELARGVMDDLRRVAREEGVPTVINIHDVALARAYADRIVGIAGGLIVFDGRPAELDDEALDRIYRAAGLPGTPDSPASPGTPASPDDSEVTVGDDRHAIPAA
jgi:phosphonate transport system ATP-binding protein